MNNSTANDQFIAASRKKIRFATSKGQLTCEDLWDLNLESLDRIAVSLDEVIQQSGKKSFIGKRDTASAVNELAFDIVKHVIDTKLAEAERAKVRAARRTERDFLAGLLADKQTAELQQLSREEIEKRLAALDSEDA